MSAMDLLAGFELQPADQQKEVLQMLINCLSDYTKPRTKGTAIQPDNDILGAYLHVSNARNFSQLAIIDRCPLSIAGDKIHFHLENALTFII